MDTSGHPSRLVDPKLVLTVPLLLIAFSFSLKQQILKERVDTRPDPEESPPSGTPGRQRDLLYGAEITARAVGGTGVAALAVIGGGIAFILLLIVVFTAAVNGGIGGPVGFVLDYLPYVFWAAFGIGMLLAARAEWQRRHPQDEVQEGAIE